MEFVILVDENDQPIGQMEKQAAHVTPHLHRAFSIFIFNSKGELLMQQRALSKYHSPAFGPIPVAAILAQARPWLKPLHAA